MKKLILAVLFLTFVISCGQGIQGPKGEDGSDGQPCTVFRSGDNVVISCPDGTSTTINDADDEDEDSDHHHCKHHPKRHKHGHGNH